MLSRREQSKFIPTYGDQFSITLLPKVTDVSRLGFYNYDSFIFLEWLKYKCNLLIRINGGSIACKQSKYDLS
jgi:hypothetical protein